MPSDFVPPDFAVPTEVSGSGLRLRPLAEEDNPKDFAAWTSSKEHIHATPGFEGRPWPHDMTLEENRADLQGHVNDFASRQGFTYTVLDDSGETIGCVYLYPSDDAEFDVSARSWVRADRSGLDVALYQLVRQWLRDCWPFTAVDYAAR
jgi:hypothetical protein